MVLRPLLWMLSLFFPARFLKIPGTVHVKRKDDADVVKYLPPSLLTKENGAVRNLQSSKKQNQSLVVFSHGLTGTGEENSIFCTSLAKKGYVVASSTTAVVAAVEYRCRMERASITNVCQGGKITIPEIDWSSFTSGRRNFCIAVRG